RARPGELDAAYHEEKEHLRKTGRLTREERQSAAAETRATSDMTVGTGSEGGFLSPETWDTMVYGNLSRVSILRKFAYWFPMQHNIKRLPKVTANVAAATTAELGV